MNEKQDLVGEFLESEQGEKNYIKLLTEKGEIKVRYFMPWTKKDGTEKKGITPEQMEPGKTYKIMCDAYKEDDTWDFWAYTAITIFRQEVKQQTTLGGNVEVIKEYAQRKFTENPEIDRPNFYLNYFAENATKDMQELEKAYNAK